MELDARDRQKEKEELEELRVKIFASTDGEDPNVEFAKVTENKSLELKFISLSKNFSLRFLLFTITIGVNS